MLMHAVLCCAELCRVLYTIPVGQNPTGATMSTQRIAEVYAVARKWDLVIIEDDAYYWLQFPNGPDDVPGLSLRRTLCCGQTVHASVTHRPSCCRASGTFVSSC